MQMEFHSINTIIQYNLILEFFSSWKCAVFELNYSLSVQFYRNLYLFLADLL